MNSNKFISILGLVISIIAIFVGILIIGLTNNHPILNGLCLSFWVIICIICIIALNWNNCYLKHTWSKWEQYEEKSLYLEYGRETTFIQSKQKRYCLNCNKIQIEDIQ